MIAFRTNALLCGLTIPLLGFALSSFAADTPTPVAEVHADAGWYFSVSRKVAGKWLYVRDAWNSDGPQTPAPQASAKK